MKTPSSKHRLLRWGLVACLAVVLGLGGTLGYVIATSKPPLGDLEAARLALAGAVSVEAQKYARAELEIAQSYYRQAYLAYRRAEARLLGFRDYEQVSRSLEEARRKANEAMDAGRLRRDQLCAQAEELIAAAERGLKAAREGVSRVPFGSFIRSKITQAEVALAEARKRYMQGDYPGATDRASTAHSGLEIVNERIDSFMTQYTTGTQAQKWNRWIHDTIKESRASGATAVIVDKMNHRCYLYRVGRILNVFQIDLGASASLPKMRAGDRATPEGRYRVTVKRGRGETAYYKALMINYPNDEDRKNFLEARQKGWIPRRSRLGGLIEIHGEGGRKEDWTLGCVALRNPDMDRLFEQVQVGTPVTIVGLAKEVGAAKEES